MKRAIFFTVVLILAVAFSAIAFTPALAANPTPVQIFYVPLPEAQVRTFMHLLGADSGAQPATSTTDSTISIVAADNGTIIYYDEGEDNYEATLSEPVQATTKIWGDGLASTGCPPNKNGTNIVTCTDGVDVLNAGDVVVLRNNVPLPRTSAVLYDGGDKFGGTKALAVTRAQWDTAITTRLGVAVDVYDTSVYGTSFTMPAGENLTTDLGSFDFARLFVMAAQDTTSCTFKSTSFTLNQGQSYYSGSTVVNYGDTLTCDKPVQADLASGDTSESPGGNGSHESRWYPLYPTNQWSTGYYSPVGRSSSGFPSRVFIYNGNATQITVTWTRSNLLTAPNSGTFTVGAGATYAYDIAYDSGTSFTSSLPFFAIQAVDLPNPNSESQSQYYDWGFTLIPQNLASDELIVGWGPGNSLIPPKQGSYVNGSPIWVTAVDSGTTTVYVDYDGDPSNGYNTTVTLSQWQSARIGDPNDFDQTRMRVYTTDGKKIVAAWGEDASTAGFSDPYLDLGTTIRPLPRILGGKSSALATDLVPSGDRDGDGQPSPGDVLRFIIKIENRGSGSATVLVLTDGVPTYTTYNTGSTEVSFNGAAATPTWTAVPDNASPTTLFPLDEGGYNFPAPPNPNGAGVLLGKATYLVRFLVTIVNPTPPNAAEIEIKNAANWSTNVGEVPVDVTTRLNVLDWGDLPDDGTTYGFCTLQGSNGARHSNSGLYLGTAADPNRFDRDTNGFPSVNADGDNNNNLNDETGVNFHAINANWSGPTSAVDVTVSGGNGCLNAWMDFTNDTGSGLGGSNRDFNFTKTAGGYDTYTTTYSEWLIQNRPVVSGLNNVTFLVPPGLLGTSSREYYFRFRLSPRYANGTCDTPVTPEVLVTDCGLVQGGEVEDYKFTFSPLAVTLASFTAEAQTDGVTLTWETVSEQDNAGFNVYRSTAQDQQGAPVAFVPAQTPGSPEGASYAWQDANVTPGNTYFYWLEDVALDGTRTLHEPVSVAYAGPTSVHLMGMAAGPVAGALPWAGALILALGGAALVLRRRR